jgi:hypothetical protein
MLSFAQCFICCRVPIAQAALLFIHKAAVAAKAHLSSTHTYKLQQKGSRLQGGSQEMPEVGPTYKMRPHQQPNTPCTLSISADSSSTPLYVPGARQEMNILWSQVA